VGSFRLNSILLAEGSISDSLRELGVVSPTITRGPPKCQLAEAPYWLTMSLVQEHPQGMF
jgi:hypothetical protein